MATEALNKADELEKFGGELKFDVDGVPKTSSYDGGASIYTVTGRTGVLVLGEGESIGGAVG